MRLVGLSHAKGAEHDAPLGLESEGERRVVIQQMPDHEESCISADPYVGCVNGIVDRRIRHS